MSQGYTIIELVIVVVISSLLLSVGYAQYRDFANRQEVQVARRQIDADLRHAQADALAGRKPAGCNGTLEGYAFEIIVAVGFPSPEYETYALCSDPAGVKLDVKTVSVLSILDLSPVPSVNPIIFRPFTYGTNLDVNLVSISIAHTMVAGASTSISVYRNGEIR